MSSQEARPLGGMDPSPHRGMPAARPRTLAEQCCCKKTWYCDRPSRHDVSIIPRYSTGSCYLCRKEISRVEKPI